MPKKKKITCIRQYLRGSAICLRPQSYKDFTIIRKKYKVRQYSFFSLSTMTTTKPKNPNHQNCVFYILRIGFIMGYKTGQKICRPKPPLHGLSFRKSPIKNHITLFRSGRVVNRIKQNQAPQSPTNIFALYVSNMQRLNGNQERSLEMQIVSQEYDPFLPCFIIVKQPS